MDNPVAVGFVISVVIITGTTIISLVDWVYSTAKTMWRKICRM